MHLADSQLQTTYVKYHTMLSRSFSIHCTSQVWMKEGCLKIYSIQYWQIVELSVWIANGNYICEQYILYTVVKTYFVHVLHIKIVEILSENSDSHHVTREPSVGHCCNNTLLGASWQILLGMVLTFVPSSNIWQSTIWGLFICQDFLFSL